VGGAQEQRAEVDCRATNPDYKKIKRLSTLQTHTHTHTYIYIYVYIPIQWKISEREEANREISSIGGKEMLDNQPPTIPSSFVLWTKRKLFLCTSMIYMGC
jgi:hypothetical protein